MSQQRKYRGFKTERVVADYLSTWWPGATVGRGAGKDIVNIPMDIEVKARASFSPLEWLRQVKKRTEKTGELSLVCVRMNGQGDSSPEQYLAFLTFGDLVQLLLKAGYGQIQADSVNLEPIHCKKCGAWMIEGAECSTCRKANNADL
jgi:hypothetical protein